MQLYRQVIARQLPAPLQPRPLFGAQVGLGRGGIALLADTDGVPLCQIAERLGVRDAVFLLTFDVGDGAGIGVAVNEPQRQSLAVEREMVIIESF